MPKLDKRKQAEAGLPVELRGIFDTLVEDYKTAAVTHAIQASVDYNILAELIRTGWRKGGDHKSN